MSDEDRIRDYIEKSPVCTTLGERQGKLLRFLVKRTIDEKPPQAITVATDHDGLESPTLGQENQVRDRISRLRYALRVYYRVEGVKDRVRLSLPVNTKRTGYRIVWSFVDEEPDGSQSTLASSARERPWIDTLSRAGLANAFRIHKQNHDRLRRVKDLISEELKEERPHFQLLASSGFSYLNPMGTVWAAAGLKDALSEREARCDVVLESPFSDFATCRALANDSASHHWESKVPEDQFEKLQGDCPNLSIRVTELPVNCSLFFTRRSVFYDPYLWARPRRSQPTENNFWVLEFRRGEQGYDCYELLGKHFEFLWQNGVALREFLSQKPSFEQRTKLFEKRVGTRIRQARPKGRRV